MQDWTSTRQSYFVLTAKSNVLQQFERMQTQKKRIVRLRLRNEMKVQRTATLPVRFVAVFMLYPIYFTVHCMQHTVIAQANHCSLPSQRKVAAITKRTRQRNCSCNCLMRYIFELFSGHWFTCILHHRCLNHLRNWKQCNFLVICGL